MAKSPSENQIVIYETPDGKKRVEVRFENENVWLTQKLMAQLFEVTVPTVNEHLTNIFKTKELDKNSVIRKFRITAPELIAERADHTKRQMGLTNFPGFHQIERDIYIAKNYLNEDELQNLNRIVDAYLSFAEIQARDEKAMHMKDWIQKLDEFMMLLGKGVLKNAGTVSAEKAETIAQKEYETYRKNEDKKYISDFDKAVKKYLKK